MSVIFNNEMSLKKLRELNPENLKDELLDLKIKTATAEAEIFEKLENDKLMLMNALAEVYEKDLK